MIPSVLAMSQATRQLKILQWNVASINKRKPNLLNLLSHETFDILILCETWLKPGVNMNIYGYNSIQNNRIDGKGGVAILISKNIRFKIKSIKQNFSNNIETCAVFIEDMNLSLVSLYKPPKYNVSVKDWENLFSQFNGDTIFCGDFNCHHTLWGSARDQVCGTRLVDALNNTNYIILNDGSPTKINRPTQNKSAIDLSVASPNLVSKLNWSVLPDPLGSDHFPILLQYNTNYTPQNISPSTRWNVASADWTLFSSLIKNNLLVQTGNDMSLTKLIDIISDSASSSMKINQPVCIKTPHPLWWDEECSAKVLQRKKALLEYKNLSNWDNYLKYKNIESQTKLLFKTKSMNSWKDFLNNLNKNTPIDKIWNFIKKISNKKYCNSQSYASTEMIDKLLDYFAPPTASNTFTSTTKITHCSNFPCNHFSLSELESALLSRRGTAPGSDNITYKMLTFLPSIAKNALLDIFNKWWLNSRVFDELKETIIVLILKPKKDPNNISSYRPISLMSCIMKTFERMIKARLEWYLEYNSKLPHSQYGCRRGMGTMEAVSQLVSDVQYSFSKNLYVGCLFVDLKGAYDSVDLNILTESLISLNVHPQISYDIVDLFRNRKIYIKDNNNVLHGPRVANHGLPQGAALSPLLFNVYTYSLHNIFDSDVKCIQYVDDFCFYTTQDNYNQCVKVLKYIVYCLKTWFSDHALTISPEKSAVMFFTRHRLHLTDTLTLSGLKIPIKTEYKYLGVVLDNKLLWGSHINHLKSKAEKGINMLKCVTKTKWGADPKIALLFYRAYIRSILDYGCILYGSAANVHLKKIDRVQYSAIRICIGALKSSPTPAILAEAREPPLGIRRNYLAFKKLCYLKFFNYNNTLNQLVPQLSIENLTNKYWNKKNSPPLADAYIIFNKCIDLITPHKKLPIFELEFSDITFGPRVIFPTYSEIHTVNQSRLNEIINKYDSFFKIFTDGSKSTSGTGSAVYISDTSTKLQYKISDTCSIFTAEIFAIEEALQWLIKQKLTQNALIMSDSKSVLEAISNLSHKKLSTSRNICNIKKLLHKLSIQGNIVIFIWVKGHAGILGNVKVDSLAKEATKLPNVIGKYDFSDIINKGKIETRKIWEKSWIEFTKKSNNHYTLIHPTLPNCVPHIDDYAVSRAYSVTITRLKLNHAKFPAHLHRIGVAETNICSCDNESIADLNHIFFSCGKYSSSRPNFLRFITNSNIAHPFNLTTLLSMNNKNVLDQLITFLRESKLDI